MIRERNLDYWLDKLQPESLPVFNKTVQEILSITDNEDSSATELARVILSDPSMTAHILQVANRVPYNPSAQAIATVSQAVLVLGFKSISRLSLTKALIDTLLQGTPQKYLLEMVSRSLHAAVQAQSLAVLRKDPAPEDVFIATLLMRIGDIALWSLSPDNSEQVAELMFEQGLSMETAQKEVYGFSGAELSQRLSREWQLGELLSESLSTRGSGDPRIQCIRTGEALAACYAQTDLSDLDALLPRMKGLVKKSSDEQLRELVADSAEEARDMAQRYGLPVDGIIGELQAEDTQETVEPTWLEPDPQVQLQILGEISSLLEEKPDINLLLEMVAEGIYRGLGMDTVFFALLAPDHKSLNIRFILSQDIEAALTQRTLAVTPGLIIEHVLSETQAIWCDKDQPIGLDTTLASQSGGQDFLIKSITIGPRAIGLFYADRAQSGRPLDETAFSGFRQFCQQANLGLSYLQGRG